MTRYIATTRRNWVPRQHVEEWQADERTYVALLDHLTRDRLNAEAVDAELHATARRNMVEVQEAQQEQARHELAEARQELRTFRAALEDAHARAGTDGSAEVPFDARDPRQDEYADALIQYLVRPGYAEVRTEEAQPGTYVYFVRVDWPRLRELAAELGHPIAA